MYTFSGHVDATFVPCSTTAFKIGKKLAKLHRQWEPHSYSCLFLYNENGPKAKAQVSAATVGARSLTHRGSGGCCNFH